MSFNSLPQNNYYQSEDNQFLDFTLPDDMADIDFTQYLTEGAFQEHNVTVNSSDSLPNFAMGHTNTQLSNDNGMIYQAQDSFVVDSSDNVDGGNYANNNVFSQDDASISCYPEFNTMEIPNFYDGEAMQTGYTGDMGNDTFVLPQAPQFHMPPIDSEVQKMFDMHFNDLLRTEKSFLLLSKTLFGRLTGQQKLDLAKLTGEKIHKQPEYLKSTTDAHIVYLGDAQDVVESTGLLILNGLDQDGYRMLGPAPCSSGIG